jgi:glycosidase
MGISMFIWFFMVNLNSATNFYNLNSQFGSEQDFINFVNECHQRDVWVMVDVVFNHVGPYFFYFKCFFF